MSLSKTGGRFQSVWTLPKLNRVLRSLFYSHNPLKIIDSRVLVKVLVVC